MIRVLLVDDDATVRLTLCRALESYADVEVIGEATDGDDAVRNRARATTPDVIVMDVHMPRVSGITALNQLRHEGVRAALILLTADAEIADREDLGDVPVLVKGRTSMAQTIAAVRAAAV